jgi:threonine dehydrogenase-like Zn-dependent dehydrogenase
MLSCHKIEADQIVSHTFPLKEWKAAFESLERLEAIKVLLVP